MASDVINLYMQAIATSIALGLSKAVDCPTQ